MLLRTGGHIYNDGAQHTPVPVHPTASWSLQIDCVTVPSQGLPNGNNRWQEHIHTKHKAHGIHSHLGEPAVVDTTTMQAKRRSTATDT